MNQAELGPRAVGSSAAWRALVSDRALVAAYWIGVLVVAASVFVPRILPCVDYPQHLALADVWRRLSVDPNAPEHATYVVNRFTYNGSFHLAVATLARVLPIDLAGRLVVSLSLVALGGGVYALLRALDRPIAWGALFTPALFSFSLGWGFVNYATGMALVAIALALHARLLVKPSWKVAIAAALVGLACAFTHVLATILLCILAAALAPEVAWRAVDPTGRISQRLLRASARAAVGLAPLAAPCAYCLAVFKAQYAKNPAMYRDPTLESATATFKQKVQLFADWTTGLHGDGSDRWFVWGALAIFAFAWIVRAFDRAPKSEASAPIFLPLVAATVAYFATPMVFIGTHMIFPRLTQAVFLTLVLATPRLSPRAVRFVVPAPLVLGAFAAANLFAHMVSFARETDDLARVIDEAPPGRRASSVVYGSVDSFNNEWTLVHLAAYYAATKHGDWAYSFGRFLSVPVTYKEGAVLPPWPSAGWEFNPSAYDPRCNYARTFDLVFVKPPAAIANDEAAVRAAIFKDDAAAVRVVSHHGGYWAFDTAGLPRDDKW